MRDAVLALLLTLWAAVPASAAIAVRQSPAAQGNSTSPSVALTTPQAGNAVVVVLLQNNSATPSQTAGDTLTSDFRFNDSGSTTTFFSNLSISGANNTYTFSITATQWTIWAFEVNGLARSSAFDQQASTAQAAATTHSSGTTPTTTAANEFCIAAFNGDGTGSSRTFSSWTNGFTTPTNGDQLTLGAGIVSIVGTKIVSATGAQETTLQTTASYTATGAIATYKGATGGVLLGGNGNSVASGSCGSPCSISVTRTTTAGNAVLVSWLWNNNCPTVTQPGGGGDTLTERQSQSSLGACAKHYSNYNVAGGSTTYTLQVTGSAENVSMCVAEFSGLNTSAAFDKGTASALVGGATTISTGTTAALAQTGEVAFATMHGDGSGGTSNTLDSTSNGFINIAACTNVLNAAGVPYINAYKLAPLTSGGEGVTWDFNGADAETGLGIITTYKEAAGGGCTPTLLLLGVGRCG